MSGFFCAFCVIPNDAFQRRLKETGVSTLDAYSMEYPKLADQYSLQMDFDTIKPLHKIITTESKLLKRKELLQVELNAIEDMENAIAQQRPA